MNARVFNRIETAAHQATRLPLVDATAKMANLELVDDATLIRRSVLPGGVRVITQQVPAVRSVAIGAWIAVGSRDETERACGSTHYLEHLLFKGTHTRSALDIATTFDSLGGDANAQTAKEYTCYYARILRRDLERALEVIMDMVTAPALRANDFQMEQTVILEELAAAADDPADVAHEAWVSAVFGDNPLARPVGGTPESVCATTLEHVRGHWEENYSSPNLVIAAAGAVDHERLIEQILTHLRVANWDTSQAVAPRGRIRREDPAPAGAPIEKLIENDIEQAHVLLGTPSLAASDPRRPVMSVLLAALGGGMSSRLFQTIREQRGLAYATYAFDTAYSDYGAFAMYAACAPKNRLEVSELMRQQLRDISRAGLEPAELARAKSQLRGGIALGLEDTASRMFRLGKAEAVSGEIYTIEQIIERIEAVDNEAVSALAADLCSGPEVRVVVGRKEG